MARSSGPIESLIQLSMSLFPIAIGVALLLAGGGNLGGSVVALVFIGFGGTTLVTTLRNRRSREAQGRRLEVRNAPALVSASDYRAPHRESSAADVYGPIAHTLPLPNPPERTADTGFARLSHRAPDGGIGEAVFSLVWNGFSWVMFLWLLLSGEILPALFMLIFVGAGAYLGYSVLHRLLGRRKLPEVLLEDEPVHLGEGTRLRIVQRGPANITRLTVTLRCDEHVSYTVGTDTREESFEVFEQELLVDALQLGLQDERVFDLRVDIPAQGPCSFKSANNELTWGVAVHAEIAGWPDYDETFTFRALPRVVS